MRTNGQRKAVRKAGRAALVMALAIAAAGSPQVRAASRSGAALQDGDATPVSCGEPAISGAPAMVVCDSGGEGATACETRHVISVGGIGTISGCGISCTTGTYACCQDPTVTKRANCTCRQDPPRGPWTPEAPQ